MRSITLAALFALSTGTLRAGSILEAQFFFSGFCHGGTFSGSLRGIDDAGNLIALKYVEPNDPVTSCDL